MAGGGGWTSVQAQHPRSSPVPPSSVKDTISHADCSRVAVCSCGSTVLLFTTILPPPATPHVTSCSYVLCSVLSLSYLVNSSHWCSGHPPSLTSPVDRKPPSYRRYLIARNSLWRFCPICIYATSKRRARVCYGSCRLRRRWLSQLLLVPCFLPTSTCIWLSGFYGKI